MKHLLRTLCLLIPGLTGCNTLNMTDEAPHPHTVNMEQGPEAEVRAALVHILSVAKHKDLPAFKTLILPADLPDFEAREKDTPGTYQSMMASISAEKPKDYRLDLNGSLATFTAQPTPKMGDYRKKENIRLVLVRDGDQWKLGKS